MPLPGKKFDLKKAFKEANITFASKTEDIFNCLINNVGATFHNDNTITYPGPQTNGFRHWFAVSILSRYVASEMLSYEKTKAFIDAEINALSPTLKTFLISDKYANYLKLIELLGMFHDTGRANSGVDQPEWEEASAENASLNIQYLLETTNLPKDDYPIIMNLLRHGILGGKSPKEAEHQNKAFMFGGPLGVGDSLDIVGFKETFEPKNYIRAYDPRYVFQGTVNKIAELVEKVMPHNQGLIIELKYGLRREDKLYYLKPNFVELILQDYREFINHPNPLVPQPQNTIFIQQQISRNLHQIYKHSKSKEDFTQSIFKIINADNNLLPVLEKSFETYRTTKDNLDLFSWIINVIKEFFGYGLAQTFAQALEANLNQPLPNPTFAMQL